MAHGINPVACSEPYSVSIKSLTVYGVEHVKPLKHVQPWISSCRETGADHDVALTDTRDIVERVLSVFPIARPGTLNHLDFY